MWAKSWLTKSLTKGREECGVGPFLNYHQPAHPQRQQGGRKTPIVTSWNSLTEVLV